MEIHGDLMVIQWDLVDLNGDLMGLNGYFKEETLDETEHCVGIHPNISITQTWLTLECLGVFGAY